MSRTSWPGKYLWLHEYALAKPDAVADYKESWDALRYFVHGKIFALLVRNKTGTLLNLKCDPYLSLDFRARFHTVQPGWHMNKLHWISLHLKGKTPQADVIELVDISYSLVKAGLPLKIRRQYDTDSGE